MKKSTYRKHALPHLIKDFESRCAYSGLHLDHADGKTEMEIDHFDPHKKRDALQRYDNLFLCSGHCNRMKGTRWPSKEQVEAGARYINPCEELDYGFHILEERGSGILIGITEAGEYQIEMLDLNALHLVRHRRQRYEQWELLEKPSLLKRRASPDEVGQLVGSVLRELQQKIPRWPHDRVDATSTMKPGVS